MAAMETSYPVAQLPITAWRTRKHMQCEMYQVQYCTISAGWLRNYLPVIRFIVMSHINKRSAELMQMVYLNAVTFNHAFRVQSEIRPKYTHNLKLYGEVLSTLWVIPLKPNRISSRPSAQLEPVNAWELGSLRPAHRRGASRISCQSSNIHGLWGNAWWALGEVVRVEGAQ